MVIKIKRDIHGTTVDLEYIRLKNYKNYSLWQVYKTVNGRSIPVYTECLTEFQIKKLRCGEYEGRKRYNKKNKGQAEGER